MIRKANREDCCHRSFTLRARCLVLTAVVSLVLSASASNATDCPTSADEISTDRPDFTSPPLGQKNKPRHPDLDPTRREKLVEGQSPFASIPPCSDSRVRRI